MTARIDPEVRRFKSACDYVADRMLRFATTQIGHKLSGDVARWFADVGALLGDGDVPRSAEASPLSTCARCGRQRPHGDGYGHPMSHTWLCSKGCVAAEVAGVPRRERAFPNTSGASTVERGSHVSAPVEASTTTPARGPEEDGTSICVHGAWNADGSCCTCGARGTAPWYRWACSHTPRCASSEAHNAWSYEQVQREGGEAPKASAGQIETPPKLAARRPLPPDVLVSALQDRVHREDGAVRPAKSVKVPLASAGQIETPPKLAAPNAGAAHTTEWKNGHHAGWTQCREVYQPALEITRAEVDRQRADEGNDAKWQGLFEAALALHDAFLRIDGTTRAVTMNQQWARLHAELSLLGALPKQAAPRTRTEGGGT